MYGKLVRDGVPEIIRKDTGKLPSVRYVTDREEADEVLLCKLVEEALEAQSAKGKRELVEELADLKQVLITVQGHFGISEQEVEWNRRRKLSERGGFSELILLLPEDKSLEDGQ